MNIGETDADGWTYVRFGDAAKAAQDGTHEAQRTRTDGSVWGVATIFFKDVGWQYRLREKARTITVTIPRPSKAYWHCGNVELVFSTEKHAINAWQAIRNAMEQS